MNDLIKNEGSLNDKQVESLENIINGEFYLSNGQLTPNSKKIQELATKARIGTKVISQHQDDNCVKIVVRGCDITGFCLEDGVTIHFNTILQDKLVSLYEKELEAYKKWKNMPVNKDKTYNSKFFNDMENPFELKSDGGVLPNLTFKGQFKIIKDMVRYKTYASRIGISIATQRVQRRLLNQELPNEPENISPKNREELIDKHSEMMKKHSFLPNEEIDQNTEKLKQDFENDREEQVKKEKREGQVITGEISKKKQNNKTTVEKAIENSEKRAEENKERELTVLYLAEDFEEISDEKLVETIIERTKSHLNAESGEAEINDVRKLFILHKEELNHLRDGRSNLADECVKTLAGAK